MLISAIHFPEFYLFNNKPATINFGGRYFYSVDEFNNITRQKNEKYIDQFYSNKNLELITALVGKNGIGKTSTLEAIIDALKRDRDFLHGSVVFYEEVNTTYIQKNHTKPIYNFTNFEPIEGYTDYKVIYYSPHIDFKDSQFGYLDFRLDNIINEDFKINRGLQKDLYDLNPIKSHQFANDLRLIEFRDSKFSKIIENICKIPSPNGFIISFNDFKIEYNETKIYFHNTPYAYRTFIQELANQIENESNEIVRLTIPQVEIQLKLMKNYFIRYILQQIIKKMEELNQYLSIGELPEPPKGLLDSKPIEIILEWFLDNHYVKFSNKTKFKPLPIDEIKDLISYFQVVINSLNPKNERDKTHFDWDSKTIIVTKEQAIELLRLQKNYIVKLSSYYREKRNVDFDSLSYQNPRIHNLMNFEYSYLKLSSGEISLLNLFSRFYSYFKKHFDDFGKIPTGNTYLVLLDEGDSGFHPEWKKKYVSIIIPFFESFFEKYNATVQIIFTTHDPLTLSDIPNYNVVYLSEKDGKKVILNETEKPQKSFGANINDLLSDSFFVEDGLIGDFAKAKINEVIEWLNFKSNTLESTLKQAIFKDNDYYGKLIEIIDEPIIKNKLREMFINVTQDEKFIDLEIQRLQNLKKNP